MERVRVEQLENKNQFIIYGENGVYFQSYNSLIARIDANGCLTLWSDWNYSKTTLKHLYLFFNKFHGACNSATRAIIEKLENSTKKSDIIYKAIENKKINFIVD